MQFSNIPVELRLVPSWVCWRYEQACNGKPTKVPYNPLLGKKASVTSKDDWCSFDQCVYVVENTDYYSGIGFVLSCDDPYTIIDLDDPIDNEDTRRRQAYIYEHFQSYTELSPSGKGVHIVVKAHVPSGRKRQKIEIYSDTRYMTFTGNVLKPLPIAEYQHDVRLLWDELEGSTPTNTYEGSTEATLTDDEVLERCATASNSDKFFILWTGQWQHDYGSQSEADLALMNILAYFSENRAQVTRLFHLSELGKRDKARRDDYTQKLLNKAFDRIAPPIDFSWLIRRNQDNEKSKKPLLSATTKDEIQLAATTQHDPQKLLYDLMRPIPLYAPPGTVGDLAKAFYECSPRPVYDFAIVAALGMMAGIAGRTFNVSKAGLNQYFMVLASAGVGKETMANGINQVMRLLEFRVPSLGNYYKSGNIQSAPALIKLFNDQPCIFAIKGEYGHELRKMSSPNAPALYTDLKAVMLDLYSKSGKDGVLKPLTYSDKAKNTPAIQSPSFTFICESTPDIVYESMDENLVSDGLLSRFNILNYTGNRPPLNKHHETYEFPDHLINKLADLGAYCTRMMHENKVVNVPAAADAQEFLDRIDYACDAFINANMGSAAAGLYIRVHLKTLKLAALLAATNNPFAPCITLDDAMWAYNFISMCTRDLIKQFEDGRVGNPASEARQMKIIRDALQDYLSASAQTLKTYGGNPALRDAGVIPYTFLYRKSAGKPAFKQDKAGTKTALAKILGVLIDTGEIVEVSPKYLRENFNAVGRAFLHNKPLT